MPDDNSTGASFGVFPQMKPTRSFQDPEASKDMPVQMVRGAVKTGLGMIPDIAQLATDIAGSDTKLPLTSDWWEQKLPLKATSPEGRLASSIGEYSPFNPLMEAVPKAIGKGVRMAGQGLSEAMMGQGPEWLKSIVPQPKFIHHESTLKNPNPLVGTNYKTTDLGGLLPEKPLDLESKKGAQASMWDWDSSSTNKAINEVSGEKLPQDVITHGGFLYPLDPTRASQGVVGSSNEGIANRVVDRDAIARLENLMQGGTGEVIHIPTTMGPYSENFSIQPSSVLDQLLAKRYIEDPKNHAKIVNDLNTDVKLSKPKKGFPFQEFAGVETPLGQQQLYQTGIVKDGVQVVPPGKLRKALLDVAYNKKHQKAIGFNAEDISNAITEPDLIGVPKGYMGKTVISSGDMPMHTIAGSDIGSYDTRFGNDVAHYAGTLGTHIPVETIFKNQLENFDNLMRIKKGKAWDNQSDVVKRNQLINMLANSKETNFSQILDNETLDRIGKEIERQANMKKAKGGSVHMSDNLDTQWAETAFAGGGKVGLAEDAVSLIKGIMEGLGTKEVSKAEAEANKAKFLEPSKEKNVMYHGTFSDFNQFKPSQRGAIFVSPKTDFVNHYIGMYKSDEANKPHIMPVHVNVQNPFDYENPLHLSNLYDEYAQVKGKPLPEKTKQQISEGHWYELENPEVMNLIKSLGHDSMYLTEHNDQNELVKNLGVFDPTQIKSAIGNQGTYDVTNPDITKKRGGPVHMAGGGKFGALKTMIEEAPEMLPVLKGMFEKGEEGVHDMIKQVMGTPEVKAVRKGDVLVTDRVPALEQASQQIGKTITPEEYANLVEQHLPIRPLNFIPKPPTDEEAINALNQAKREKYGMGKEIQQGEKVGARLDIPAYTDKNTWVNSIHQEGKPTTYSTVSHIKNFTIPNFDEKALKVAQGGPKSPFAKMEGDWQHITPEQALDMAKELYSHPEWTQMGMDPRRAGHFYDRYTGQPIVGGEEALQIGPLVFGKNPVYAPKSDFAFRKGGDVHMAGGGFAKSLLKGEMSNLNENSKDSTMDAFLNLVPDVTSRFAPAMAAALYTPNLNSGEDAELATRRSMPANIQSPAGFDPRSDMGLNKAKGGAVKKTVHHIDGHIIHVHERKL